MPSLLCIFDIITVVQVISFVDMLLVFEVITDAEVILVVGVKP